MLYIHPDECVDCGACEPVCPVEAIYYEDDVPEEWTEYTQANVDFFNNIGSPGGATKMGKIDHDVDFIAALPSAHGRQAARQRAPGRHCGSLRGDPGGPHATDRPTGAVRGR
ncbi:MAG: 4Fe-4S binding protein [Candidatus Nanopelagicales bacterium]|nr:4Fe-4S binding protein [Candidatus Nanopelagicales bacterium]